MIVPLTQVGKKAHITIELCVIAPVGPISLLPTSYIALIRDPLAHFVSRNKYCCVICSMFSRFKGFVFSPYGWYTCRVPRFSSLFPSAEVWSTFIAQCTSLPFIVHGVTQYHELVSPRGKYVGLKGASGYQMVGADWSVHAVSSFGFSRV